MKKIFLIPFFGVILCAFSQAQNTLIQYSDASTLSNNDFTAYQKYMGAPVTQEIYLISLGDINQFQNDGKIIFSLPGSSQPVTMVADRVEYTDNQHYVWQGAQIVQDSVRFPGHMLLIRDGDEFVGEIAIDQDFYLISSLSGTRQVLIKTKDLPGEIDSYPTSNSEDAVCIMGSDECTIDIVIAYTADCLVNYPNMAMLGRLCFEQMNAAMLRSKIKHKTKLAGVFQWNGSWSNASAELEGPKLKMELEDPGSWASQIKFSLDADLLILLTPGVPNPTAIGYANEIPASNFENGSGVVYVNYAISGAYVYSHEVGHLLGARHEDDNTNLPARAHEFDATFNGNQYHYLTIMHNETNQILNYSNPNVNYISVPTGTSDRFNACVMQNYGCSVSQIQSSDECRIKTTVTNNNCSNVQISAGLLKDDGTTCNEGVYWEFDYSYDGVNYTTGVLSSNPKAIVPYPADICKLNVFIRIKVYDATQTPITNSFVWFDRPCICTATQGGTKREMGDNTSKELVTLFPNPTTSEVLVNFSDLNLVEGNVVINIFDVNGTTVITEVHAAKEEVASIEVKKLSAGTYFVNITQGALSYTKKIVKP